MMATRFNLNQTYVQKEAHRPTCLRLELTRRPMNAPAFMCPAHSRHQTRTPSATILTIHEKSFARSPSWILCRWKRLVARMKSCQYPIRFRLYTTEIKTAYQSSILLLSRLSPALIRRVMIQTARETSSTMNSGATLQLETISFVQKWTITQDVSPHGRSNVKRTNWPQKSTFSS